MITIPTLAWLILVAPYAACYLSPAVFLFGLLLWLLSSLTMAMAAFADPGVIARKSGTAPDASCCRTVKVNGVDVELKVCTTCGIVRPLRASHDRKTDRCVQKFDHYCVFVGNSIGQDNYMWFLAFVGITSFGALFYLAFCVFHVVNLVDRFEQGGHDSATAAGKAVGQAIGSVMLAMYFGMAGLLVTALFSLHIYLVLTGQTTPDFLKGTYKRQRNPFNKGFRGNCLELFLGASDELCGRSRTFGVLVAPDSPNTSPNDDKEGFDTPQDAVKSV